MRIPAIASPNDRKITFQFSMDNSLTQAEGAWEARVTRASLALGPSSATNLIPANSREWCSIRAQRRPNPVWRCGRRMLLVVPGGMMNLVELEGVDLKEWGEVKRGCQCVIVHIAAKRRSGGNLFNESRPPHSPTRLFSPSPNH